MPRSERGAGLPALAGSQDEDLSSSGWLEGNWQQRAVSMSEAILESKRRRAQIPMAWGRTTLQPLAPRDTNLSAEKPSSGAWEFFTQLPPSPPPLSGRSGEVGGLFASVVTTAIPGAPCRHPFRAWYANGSSFFFFDAERSQDTVIAICVFLGIRLGPDLLLLEVSVSSLVLRKKKFVLFPFPCCLWVFAQMSPFQRSLSQPQVWPQTQIYVLFYFSALLFSITLLTS